RIAGIAVTLLLAGFTLFTALPASPLFRRLTTDLFRPYRVAGDELWLGPWTTGFLEWAQGAVGAHVPPGEPIPMAPNLPGLYPLFGRRSPVWNVYAIWPSEGRLGDRMLPQLQARDVKWALLENAAVDGQGELRFRYTHPQTWGYLMSEFEPVEVWQRRHPMRGVLLKRRAQ